MTKKELMDSDVFASLPDDAEVVFATDANICNCVRLNELGISIIRQCVNVPEKGGVIFQPIYRTALVIDAIPYWYLKEKYGVSISDDTKDLSE